METTTEKIGPEEARAYLETMGVPSYPVDPKFVSALASRMKSGAWLEGGEAIAVTEEGQMVNGRRRMHAIVESGATIEFVVIKWRHEEFTLRLVEEA